MTNIVEEGDIIKNHHGMEIRVTKTIAGKYGLLVMGEFSETQSSFDSYYPYEMPPPVVNEKTWYGWPGRDAHTLANGMKICSLSFYRSDARSFIEDYEKEWERTLETIRLERMSDSNIGQADTMQSRPFIEQSRPDVL